MLLEEEANKLREYAYKVMELARTSASFKMKFLSNAITFLQLQESQFNLAVDGQFIYYNPQFVIEKYKDDASYLDYAFLHMTVHCLFQHLFMRKQVEHKLWNIACDMYAFYIINSANDPKLLHSNSLRLEEERQILNRAMHSMKVITPEHIVSWLEDNPDEIDRIQKNSCFAVDTHDVWYESATSDGGTSTRRKHKKRKPKSKSDEQQKEESQQQEACEKEEQDKQEQEQEQNQKDQKDQDKKQKSKSETDSEAEREEQEDPEKSDADDDSDNSDNSDNSSGSQSDNSDSDGTKDENDDSSDNSNEDESEDESGDEDTDEDDEDEDADDNDDGQSSLSRNELAQKWQNMAQRAQTSLDTGFMQGDSAGNALAGLQEVTKESISYEDFLRKFSILTEQMVVNMDEFDYAFYTYGLELYGNVPLIEPLEYKETKRIHDFVIAIDTSGSTFGSLVQKFLSKTFNILSEQNSFDSRVCIHIIQCDTRVRSDVKIENVKDMEEYMRTFQIYGGGGTDFRPVFSYVDNLLAEKEFTDLRGLIYFTDGYGDFPLTAPKYETAFTFIGDDHCPLSAVPDWAITLELDKDEFKEAMR